MEYIFLGNGWLSNRLLLFEKYLCLLKAIARLDKAEQNK